MGKCGTRGAECGINDERRMRELRGNGNGLPVVFAPKAEGEPEVGESTEPLEAGDGHVRAVPVVEMRKVVDFMGGGVEQAVDDRVNEEQGDLEEEHPEPGKLQQADALATAFGDEIPNQKENTGAADEVQPVGYLLSNEALVAVAAENLAAGGNYHESIKGKTTHPECEYEQRDVTAQHRGIVKRREREGRKMEN